MTATRNSDNINFGPCDVSFDSAWLGLTQGNVMAEIETFVHEILTDQYGPNMPVVLFHTGDAIVVTVNMLETTVAQLAAAGVLISATNSPTDRLTFGKLAGTKLSGKRLVCAPTASGDLPLVVYNAVVYGKITWDYGLENARTVNLTFRGLPEFTRADGDMVFRIGGGAS